MSHPRLSADYLIHDLQTGQLRDSTAFYFATDGSSWRMT